MAIRWSHAIGTPADELDVAQTTSTYGDQFILVSKNGTMTTKYDSAKAFTGNRSIRMFRPAAADSGYNQANMSAVAARMQVRAYIWIDALPTTANPTAWNLFVFRGASTFMGNICFNAPGSAAVGKLGITDASGATKSTSIATNTFPLSQWVRVEAWIVKGTTTSNGQIEYAYYLGNSTTPIFASAVGAITNTGTVDPLGVRFGFNGTTNVPDTIWWDKDSLALGDGATGFLGPAITGIPVTTLAGTVAYLIEATSTVDSGTVSHVITQPSGPTPPRVPIEPVDGFFVVFPHPTSSCTYQITGIGSMAGATDVETWVVPSAASGAAPVAVRKRFYNASGVYI